MFLRLSGSALYIHVSMCICAWFVLSKMGCVVVEYLCEFGANIWLAE
jgi:hypothetical protein